MTDLHKDIWARIEEQRANYASIIEKADETIRAAQALKRDAREGMDALPVAKVRRPRKQGEVTVDELRARVDDVSNEAVPAEDFVNAEFIVKGGKVL